jgi:hypothetical protein
MHDFKGSESLTSINTNMVPKKPISSKTATKPIAKILPMSQNDDVDTLINRILTKQCSVIFNATENNDTIFVSTCNAIERSLKYYLGNQSKSIDFQKMRLITMIDTVDIIRQFPKDFGSFFTIVRIKSNRRHHELESAKQINLLILKLEFYKFMKWFVCSYLKREEIEVAKKWYSDLVSPKEKTNAPIIQVPKIIENTDDIEHLNEKIKHQEKVIDGLKKSERELTQEIINMKK